MRSGIDWRQNLGRILGIDPGGRRVGLALSDGSGVLASPLTIVDRNETDLSAELTAVIAQHDVEAVVVGYPQPLRTDKNERTREVDQFLQDFIQPLEVPHETISERYSSSLAETLRKQRDDADPAGDDQAAALILEQYLRSGGAPDS